MNTIKNEYYFGFYINQLNLVFVKGKSMILKCLKTCNIVQKRAFEKYLYVNNTNFFELGRLCCLGRLSVLFFGDFLIKNDHSFSRNEWSFSTTNKISVIVKSLVCRISTECFKVEYQSKT